MPIGVQPPRRSTLESLMMRGLVDVDGLRHRIPCRHHQSGPRMTDPSITQDIPERSPQRVRDVLVSVQPADTAYLAAQEIGQCVPVLAEDLGPPALVQAEYLRGGMPKGQGDTDDPARGGAGDQVEIGSDRAIEVLFEFRKEGRRKRAENAASVNAQESAPRLARSFVLLLPTVPPGLCESWLRAASPSLSRRHADSAYIRAGTARS